MTGAEMTREGVIMLIASMMAGRKIEVERLEKNLWKVDFETTRYASGLIKTHDAFDYCHVEVTNEDEVAIYREVILQDGEIEGRHIVVEGAYERKLGERSDAEAIFDGVLMIGMPKDAERNVAVMRRRLGERIVAEYVHQMRYVADGIRTAGHYLGDGGTPTEAAALMEEVSKVNRMMIEIVEGKPCSST